MPFENRTEFFKEDFSLQASVKIFNAQKKRNTDNI